MGWPKYFLPCQAPCHYPCKLESCERCQGKYTWNYSFHLAWKTSLPLGLPLLLVKEVQGKNRQLWGRLLQLLQEVSVRCELMIRPRKFTSCRETSASLHFQQPAYLYGGCSSCSRKHKVTSTIRHIWWTIWLPASCCRDLTAADVTRPWLFSSIAQTTSHIFLVDLERFMQHKHFWFPEQRSFGSKALM